MRSSKPLARGKGFSLDVVTCVDDHRGWSPAEAGRQHRMVLVHRGAFRRMADGRPAAVDPTMAYLGTPGQEERFAHPAGGDVCTSLSLSPGLWRSLAGDDTPLARSTVYVDARLELAHRSLLASARAGDADFALVESLLSLVSTTLDQLALTPTPATPSHTTGRTENAPSPATNTGESTPFLATGRGESAPSTPPGSAARPGAVPRHHAPAARSRPAAPHPGRVTARSPRAVADAAREAIAADHPAAGGLLPLAELLSVSPYQLSRAFTRELGVSLTHYRNRVRVSRALDRLESGEPSLATLAADLGFADQAHLTRTVRRHLGHTPTALRRLLASPVL
ncbi:helix-turn-helix domain-containing protein [Nonomuraea spiralis]|uniref:helix-turn-helix domain-containing protein n=1 Tax=Nonomuraea TaxID=83681 RepID=UPI002898C489|nr:helix-turn-helix domain-containing protein [Nonomuraea sp. WAC 01424]